MEFYAHIKPYLEEVERLIEKDLAAEDERIYGMLLPFIKRGGKRMRPVMSLLCCGAVGGDYRTVVEPAAIVELFHNFTLIHDDIEDNSQFRRGEPTLHITHGVPVALNSADALYTLLWQKLLILQTKPSKLIKLQKIYADSFKRVVEGQGIELSWIKSGKFDINEQDYLTMVGGKTSALMGLACEIGASVGAAGKRTRNALRDYGEKIGIAFQIQDDVLNLSGDFNKYQKEIGGDISEGKRTLIVVHCLQHANDEDKKKLTSILASHSKNQEDITEAISLLKKYGSIDYATKMAENLVKKAKARLSTLPDSKDKEALLHIADYAINRDR